MGEGAATLAMVSPAEILPRHATACCWGASCAHKAKPAQSVEIANINFFIALYNLQFF